ncbi:MAG: magnesium transporter CorA family protein [Ruminococcaceae bacterium]|nr:magnesium transporter CorA family protein [Oscillospiraceae bacterium]
MIEYFKSSGGNMRRVEECSAGTWVCVTAPDEAECESLIADFNLERDFVRSPLDEEETSRIESEDGNTLIILDIPHVEKSGDSVVYSTVPIGIIVTKENVLTISLRENPILNEFAEGVVRGLNTEFKTQFVLRIMLRVAGRYLQHLRQIDRLSTHTEQQLRKSMKSKDLIKLLDINKSLVYFSTSLKADETTLEKMMRGRYLKMYPEDQDLFEDVLIEVHQAIEMSTIYTNVLNSMMDASASLISNNLNDIMRVLAGITIVIAVPTVISGLYGMNIEGGFMPFSQWWWFPCLLSAVVMAGVAYILRRRNML